MCACLNAATLALIDAGIPLRDYVCGCSAGFVEDTPIVGKCRLTFSSCLLPLMFNYCLDINYLEQGANGPDLTVAILPRSEKVVLFYVS